MDQHLLEMFGDETAWKDMLDFVKTLPRSEAGQTATFAELVERYPDLEPALKAFEEATKKYLEFPPHMVAQNITCEPGKLNLFMFGKAVTVLTAYNVIEGRYGVFVDGKIPDERWDRYGQIPGEIVEKVWEQAKDGADIITFLRLKKRQND